MEMELLSQLAREQSYHRTALRSAKAGLFRNVVAVSSAYPLIDLPPTVRTQNRIEPALVLAIIRQESEFDPGAISQRQRARPDAAHPATAQAQARREGMTFERAH
jgi:soluble lytic murein transglycosylase